MALTLPLRTDLYSYTQSFVLDGVSVNLWLSYNTRDGRWYWSLYQSSTPFDSDGGRLPIIGGLPVNVDWAFVKQFRYLVQLPGGDFIALDESGRHLDPDKNALGNSVQLYYLTAAELAALGGA